MPILNLMRGISTVIATILLLVMIVVITAGVFYFFRGTLTTATTKGQESLTGAITETEVQAKVKVTNVVNLSGNIRFTLMNSLDDNITILRVEVGDQHEDLNLPVGPNELRDIDTTLPASLLEDGGTVMIYIRDRKGNTYVIKKEINEKLPETQPPAGGGQIIIGP